MKLLLPLLLVIALSRCAGPEPVDPPPLLGRLDIDATPALRILDRLAESTDERGSPADPEPTLELIAFCADIDTETAEAELRTASGAVPLDAPRLTFHELSDVLDETRDSVLELDAVLTIRRDVILSAVQSLLPAAAGEGPLLQVQVVVGMPVNRPTGLAPLGDLRVVLLDARQVPREVQRVTGRSDRDALGEWLQQLIAPELFYVRFEDYVSRSADWTDYPQTWIGRLLFILLNEGTGKYLALPYASRFDELGRHAPLADVEARQTIARFEENLFELTDSATPQSRRRELAFSFFNGQPGECWGTDAGTVMVDAIVRFAAPGRMKQVLARGPAELVAAYREICGRFAAVPPLSPEAAALVRALSKAAPDN